MATSPGHQESGNASSLPNRTPPPPITVQQQLQSMVAMMAELMQQNQQLTREVNRQRQQHSGERGQNSGCEGVENNVEEDQSRGTVTHRVPHLQREMDQMKRAMEEMKDSIRVNHVDDLVHRTYSPFTASITSHPLPSKFKTPTLDSYDGTHDPCDHIATFKTTMHLQGVPDEIICKAFPTTLKGLARVWFSKIPPNTMSTPDLDRTSRKSLPLCLYWTTRLSLGGGRQVYLWHYGRKLGQILRDYQR